MTASRATRFANRDSDSSTFRPLGISATIMAIEVEQKFPIQDRAALERQLSQFGARRGKTENQVDLYFAHPSRDFAALTRLCGCDGSTMSTISLTKVRSSTPPPRRGWKSSCRWPPALPEPPTRCNCWNRWAFGAWPRCANSETHWFVRWQDREIGVSLDQVVDVGDFVELEIMAETSDTDEARNCITSLAERLKLSKSERRSYLELLLAGRH